MVKRVEGDDVYVESTYEDVIIESAEDVIVDGNAVGGSLVIENAQDVIVKTDTQVSVTNSEDVVVDGDATVTVEDAADVDDDSIF